MGNFINTVNSFVRKLIYRDMYTVECSLKESRESINRLEIITEELILRDSDIRSHEMLLSIATDNLDSPIWGKDTDNNFVFMNDACAKKILNTTVADALIPRDPEHEMTPIEIVCMDSDKLVQDTMKTHRFFEHAVFDDGSDIWLDTTKSPWVLDGELVGTVGVGKDITQYVPNNVRKFYRDNNAIEIDIDLMYNANDIRRIVLG